MNKPVSVDAAVITNTGLVRPDNQDNFYLNGSFMREAESGGSISLSVEESNYQYIYAVCDGMGGEKAGEKASFAAVSELKKFHDKSVCSTSFDDLHYLVKQVNLYIGQTNKYIYNLSLQRGFRMGTTFGALVISGGQAAALNLGDTRVYHQRSGILKQLTRDHTEAQRLIRLGILSEEAAKNHKSKHQLSRFLGVSEEDGIVEADISEPITLNKGDLFLICSDGLTDMLNNSQIASIMSRDLRSLDISFSLVKNALQNGGNDNITVIVIKILEL